MEEGAIHDRVAQVQGVPRIVVQTHVEGNQLAFLGEANLSKRPCLIQISVQRTLYVRANAVIGQTKLLKARVAEALRHTR